MMQKEIEDQKMTLKHKKDQLVKLKYLIDENSKQAK